MAASGDPDLSRGSAEVDRHPFARGDRSARAVPSPQLRGALHQAVDLSVGTIRVVVKEYEPPRLCLPREADGMRHARVPPSDAVGVLVLRELAVVEEDV